MRKRTPPTQLDWRSPDEVRWEDLPAETRERARAELARLLRAGARCGQLPQEAPDEP